MTKLSWTVARQTRSSGNRMIHCREPGCGSASRMGRVELPLELSQQEAAQPPFVL